VVLYLGGREGGVEGDSGDGERKDERRTRKKEMREGGK
jgi:hypothetical protein